MRRAFAFVLLSLAFGMLLFGCIAQAPQGAQDLPGMAANSSSRAGHSAPGAAATGTPPAPDSPVPAESNSAPAAPGDAGKIIERGNYMLFVPAKKNVLNDSIIIVAFSPSGDAGSMIGAWQAAADKRGWPVFASKTFHNGADLPMSFNNDTFADIGKAAASLNYTNPKLVFTGFSGGGQVSHAFAYGSPGKVAAVVTNCGIINRGFLNYTYYYPHNKTVLFIASPTDFRYNDMKDDKAYLEALGWKTGWIEFEGGHTIAPAETYEQAADWLEQVVGGKKG